MRIVQTFWSARHKPSEITPMFIGDKLTRRYDLFLLAGVTVLLLLSGCTQKGDKAALSHAAQEDVRTKVHKDMCGQDADGLSLVLTEDTVPADRRETGELPDSLSPVHVYTFDFSDPSFPNYSDPKWGVMIKGFDTDGKGRLYIAGGKPIRLVCYNELQKEYDVVISNDTCNYAIMTLLGDSVLFVEESSKRLAVLSKDGTGEVRHQDLPFEKGDSIIGGRFLGGRLVLHVHDGSDEALQREREAEIGYFRDEFHRNVHACEVSAPSWDKHTMKRDIPDSTSYCFTPFSDDNTIFCLNGKYYGYFGNHYGMEVFYSHGIYACDIVLLDEEGRVRAKTALAQIPPIETCCEVDEHAGWFPSENLYRLKGHSFFFSGYDNETQTISFMEYDLKPLFDYANENQ